MKREDVPFRKRSNNLRVEIHLMEFIQFMEKISENPQRRIMEIYQILTIFDFFLETFRSAIARLETILSAEVALSSILNHQNK